MWHIHIMLYYLTIKRNEVLMHATTWVNFKNVMTVEEVRHTKKCILYYSIYPNCPEKVHL